MQRTLILVLGVIFVFAAAAAIMVRLMPAPLKDSDYLVIGTVATILSIFALFLGVKSPDAFFKKRKKQR